MLRSLRLLFEWRYVQDRGMLTLANGTEGLVADHFEGSHGVRNVSFSWYMTITLYDAHYEMTVLKAPKKDCLPLSLWAHLFNCVLDAKHE